MTQRRVDSWWAQWTCVGGTCAPAASPPRNGFERALDTYTSVTAPFLRGCFVSLTVAGAFFVTSALGAVSGLLVEAGFFTVAGAYCLANFARCREAHCIVTGIGWSGLALAGHGFEAVWWARRGSNALRLNES